MGSDATLSKLVHLDPGTETISDVSLNAGRLTFGQRPVGASAERPVQIWRAAVATGPVLSLGTEQPFGYQAVLSHAASGTRPAVAVSGDRTSFFTGRASAGEPTVEGEEGITTDLFPARLPVDRTLRASGKFVMFDSKVFHASDEWDLLHLPRAHPPLRDFSDLNCRGTDLYGSTIVCSRPGGTVLVWDVARAKSSTNPYLTGSNADGPVAIWGTRIAWHRTDGQIAVQTTRSGPIRLTPAGRPFTEMRMSEGALSWQGPAGRIFLLNLDAPTSTGRA